MAVPYLVPLGLAIGGVAAAVAYRGQQRDIQLKSLEKWFSTVSSEIRTSLLENFDAESERVQTQLTNLIRRLIDRQEVELQKDAADAEIQLDNAAAESALKDIVDSLDMAKSLRRQSVQLLQSLSRAEVHSGADAVGD